MVPHNTRCAGAAPWLTADATVETAVERNAGDDWLVKAAGTRQEAAHENLMQHQRSTNRVRHRQRGSALQCSRTYLALQSPGAGGNAIMTHTVEGACAALCGHI
jgi:hypothetical protein